MSVAVDAAGPGATANAVISMSWTHTPVGTPTGVGVSIGQQVAGGSTITAATYGGNAMTSEATGVSGATAERSSIYSYPSPGATPATVSITFSVNVRAAGNSLSVTGGDPADVIDNVAASAAGSGTAIASNTCTGSVDGLFIDAISTANVAGTISATAPQVELYNSDVGGRDFGGSRKAGAASTTTGWTSTGSRTWVSQLAHFKPAAAAGGFFSRYYYDMSGENHV